VSPCESYLNLSLVAGRRTGDNEGGGGEGVGSGGGDSYLLSVLISHIDRGHSR
jgi:hypothetical protein